ncbi:MAG: DUF3291 domain-containing protein [Cyanobacteria bacterium P01_B01_bin.77]
MTQKYHLAQINIVKGLSTLDDPVIKGFVDQLDRINALKEMSPWFNDPTNVKHAKERLL